eukprot:1153203-Pelagomonas_calceolata.AAC.3
MQQLSHTLGRDVIVSMHVRQVSMYGVHLPWEPGFPPCQLHHSQFSHSRGTMGDTEGGHELETDLMKY